MKQKNAFTEPGNRTVFKVPENYFEDFGDILRKRLDKVEKDKLLLEERATWAEKESKRPRFSMETFRPVLYMAAMFVMLLFSISLVLNLTSKNTNSSLRLSADSKTPSANSTAVPTAEDYLINSLGTYGITEYYVESEPIE